MKAMKSSLRAVPILFGLAFSAAGCVAGRNTEASDEGAGEEEVAEVSQAWSWSDPSRGWVDQINRTCKGSFCTGPSNPPGEYKLTGWACLKPPATATPLALVVYQGGPPGSGTALNILGSEVQYRPDTVSAGACANTDSGFGVWVDAVPALPKVFYVRYVATYPPALLEGTIYPGM